MEPMYVDAESGTYFTNQPILINVQGWTMEDWHYWDEEMSDSDRGEYAYTYGAEPTLSRPAEWMKAHY